MGSAYLEAQRSDETLFSSRDFCLIGGRRRAIDKLALITAATAWMDLALSVAEKHLPELRVQLYLPENTQRLLFQSPKETSGRF